MRYGIGLVFAFLVACGFSAATEGGVLSTIDKSQVSSASGGSGTGIEGASGTVAPEADAGVEPTTETGPSDEMPPSHCDIGDHDVVATKYKTYDPSTGMTYEGYYYDMSSMSFDSGNTLIGCRTCWKKALGVTP